ncbi:protein kinase A regulatory subunit [Thecamonas trahens ATCC 50062]|uniref:Protein kinase A regulatory subunit n=1 Tax=Thecamonas trahens ATCC 50062 TaxID=461836 RepID=A0A0L0DD41_THETB|nr:protein kinase A regulatory subunit [Thecamonas trahens ATCC 50062]KNC50026.1 protein kinase A regulatory subunit [Thecamonas trahens ATCC 50062]|eukprot:XP_013757193.1 protein kinase A regulatory subunit [Thecamonas trahens ATCC 50062]
MADSGTDEALQLQLVALRRKLASQARSREAKAALARALAPRRGRGRRSAGGVADARVEAPEAAGARRRRALLEAKARGRERVDVNRVVRRLAGREWADVAGTSKPKSRTARKRVTDGSAAKSDGGDERTTPEWLVAHRRKRGRRRMTQSEMETKIMEALRVGESRASLSEDPRSRGELELVCKCMRRLKTFEGEKDTFYLMMLAAVITARAYPGHRSVFRQGDPGVHWYIIFKGSVDVLILDQATGEERVVANIKAGDHFGDIALRETTVRAASIVTCEPCILLRVHKDDYDAIVSRDHTRKQAMLVEFLKRFRMFDSLAPKRLRQLADIVQPKAYAVGEVIIDEGDDINFVNFIRHGRVRVLKRVTVPHDQASGSEGGDEAENGGRGSEDKLDTSAGSVTRALDPEVDIDELMEELAHEPAPDPAFVSRFMELQPPLSPLGAYEYFPNYVGGYREVSPARFVAVDPVEILQLSCVSFKTMMTDHAKSVLQQTAEERATPSDNCGSKRGSGPRSSCSPTL